MASKRFRNRINANVIDQLDGRWAQFHSLLFITAICGVFWTLLLGVLRIR